MVDLKHRGANILGNFLISFFMPLGGMEIAQQIVSGSISIKFLFLTALVSSAMATGLSIGYELQGYAKGQ